MNYSINYNLNSKNNLTGGSEKTAWQRFLEKKEKEKKEKIQKAETVTAVETEIPTNQIEKEKDGDQDDDILDSSENDKELVTTVKTGPSTQPNSTSTNNIIHYHDISDEAGLDKAVADITNSIRNIKPKAQNQNFVTPTETMLSADTSFYNLESNEISPVEFDLSEDPIEMTFNNSLFEINLNKLYNKIANLFKMFFKLLPELRFKLLLQIANLLQKMISKMALPNCSLELVPQIANLLQK